MRSHLELPPQPPHATILTHVTQPFPRLDFLVAVILQKLNGDDAVLNGRSGIVQPYDLDNDQYAVKLTAAFPGSFHADTRSAVTVYDFQLRLMTKKEEKKAKDNEAAALKEEVRIEN